MIKIRVSVMPLNALINPLKLSIAIGCIGALIACSGNSSSTTTGPAVIIDPIVVDKTIAEVEWNQNNEMEMASHAYRAIARHSMLATVYSGRSSIFKSFISLVQGSRDRNCNSGGSIDAQLADPICKDSDDGVVACTVEEDGKEIVNSESVVRSLDQTAIFYRCHDEGGVIAGSYFDGPLRVVIIDDFSVDNVYQNTTTVSAVALVSKQDENGRFVLDENDQVVKVPATDFLLQNSENTFFMSHEYQLTTEYDTTTERLESRNLEECTTPDRIVEGELKLGTSIVTQEFLRTAFVAGLQEPSPQFPYTEFTNLDLTAINDEFLCEDLNDDTDVVNESLRFNSSYSLSIDNIESKALGKNTQLTWTELVISDNQEKVEGTITLTHTNPDTSIYSVMVVFDKAGSLIVTGENVSTSMSVQEFLDLSKVAAE